MMDCRKATRPPVAETIPQPTGRLWRTKNGKEEPSVTEKEKIELLIGYLHVLQEDSDLNKTEIAWTKEKIKELFGL